MLRASLVLCGSLLGALCAPAAEQKKGLTILNAALLEAEDGFAASPDTVYQPGETIYLSFNIQGYAVDRNNRVKLGYTIDALDFKGIPFVEQQAGKIDTELSAQDARWSPRVRFSATLPAFSDSGKYRLVIGVTDELARTQVSQEIPFQVRGRNVEPSPKLVVRNFRFSLQEDGDPLVVAAYRRGDTLWASFDITGYQTGEKNLVWVEYDLSVFDADGKLLYQQPQPAEDKATSFYPRRYVHAVFSLNLESGIQPGEYTIVIVVRDRLGNQTHETRQKFSIE
ncbi:MAG: hypothetical protein HY236_16640 [Acidobacteria bacterium]|nr:hypothetical protein [Acidobacteriota bacterium]